MTTTNATSTRFPVGGMPGSIQSIEIVWVNRRTISSTSLPLADGTRHWDNLEIRRNLGQAIFGIKLVPFFLAIAADHNRHLVNERLRYHCGNSFIGAMRVELCAQMLVPNIV